MLASLWKVCLLLSLTTATFASKLDLLTATVKDLQGLLADGSVTSVELVKAYFDAIEKNNRKGFELRAVIETAPTALKLAEELDKERKEGKSRGPYHGIPILIKDNIATAPELGMNNTAGNFAVLANGLPIKSSFIGTKMTKAGLIIIGKANLSEFANFKGDITNGWSARGNQTQSAYVKGGFLAGGDPCGSSAGSGVGVSAGFAPVALGSETDGSIICPSNRAALYGIKPTVGLTSRSGVIPISATQDTVGPMAKSTWDAAAILSVIAGVDPEDPATSETGKYATDYTKYTHDASFKGLRIGVPRAIFYNATIGGFPEEIVTAANAAVKKLAELGATIVDPVTIPRAVDILTSNNETIVLETEIKVGLAEYLSKYTNTTVGGIATLGDIITYDDRYALSEFRVYAERNNENPTEECCQQLLVASYATSPDSEAYKSALKADTLIGASLPETLDKYNLDVMVLPSEGYTTTLPAVYRSPIGTVPLGYLKSTGQPYGLSFIGRRYSEDVLIRCMAAWEANSPPRKVPPQLASNPPALVYN
ncbi:hypothetical protein BZG36_01023 [Bifiguratus adelaidae]|uniref:Amidase domain-containing protein n=1 Tax=Bifiguratus adelaidae TaxID=1938954 RepID=A0A261Y6H0_9FUNG|nr:hypothetical protein BZG36_01023 [Bifiguratus adelaidae]